MAVSNIPSVKKSFCVLLAWVLLHESKRNESAFPCGHEGSFMVSFSCLTNQRLRSTTFYGVQKTLNTTTTDHEFLCLE